MERPWRGDSEDMREIVLSFLYPSWNEVLRQLFISPTVLNYINRGVKQAYSEINIKNQYSDLIQTLQIKCAVSSASS